jgi:hypothetical protein
MESGGKFHDNVVYFTIYSMWDMRDNHYTTETYILCISTFWYVVPRKSGNPEVDVKITIFNTKFRRQKLAFSEKPMLWSIL